MEFKKHHRSLDAIKDKATKYLELRRDIFYSEEELNFIKEHYLTKGAKYCAERIGVTTDCVVSLANKQLGLAKSHPISKKLTPEMRQYIIDNYEQYGLAILQHSILTGVTRSALKKQARALGLVSRAPKPNCKKVYCKELDMTFDSANEAERYMLSSFSIKRCHLTEGLKSGKPVKGYHWEYVD